jgi:hypothetical protein
MKGEEPLKRKEFEMYVSKVKVQKGEGYSLALWVRVSLRPFGIAPRRDPKSVGPPKIAPEAQSPSRDLRSLGPARLDGRRVEQSHLQRGIGTETGLFFNAF